MRTKSYFPIGSRQVSKCWKGGPSGVPTSPSRSHGNGAAASPLPALRHQLPPWLFLGEKERGFSISRARLLGHPKSWGLRLVTPKGGAAVGSAAGRDALCLFRPLGSQPGGMPAPNTLLRALGGGFAPESLETPPGWGMAPGSFPGWCKRGRGTQRGAGRARPQPVAASLADSQRCKLMMSVRGGRAAPQTPA